MTLSVKETLKNIKHEKLLNSNESHKKNFWDKNYAYNIKQKKKIFFSNFTVIYLFIKTCQKFLKKKKKKLNSFFLNL